MDSEKIPLGVLYHEQRDTLETLAHLPERPIASLDLEAHLPDLERIREAYR
jgi:hypothetical protein